MQISEDVMSAITGMMLSDGHIATLKRSITGNARFMFVQKGSEIVNQLNVNILILY
jgi:hypothetical protein